MFSTAECILLKFHLMIKFMIYNVGVFVAVGGTRNVSAKVHCFLIGLMLTVSILKVPPHAKWIAGKDSPPPSRYYFINEA